MEPGWLGRLLRQLTANGRPSVQQHRRSQKQKLVSGRSSVRMWRRNYRSASKKFWQTIQDLRKGKLSSTNTVYSGG